MKNILTMANHRIEMINLRHVIRLKLKGVSKRQIARQLGMGRHTVAKYLMPKPDLLIDIPARVGHPGLKNQ